MSFRTALATLALCCAAPSAFGQTTRQIQAGYEITFVGMTGFRIDFTAKYAGNRYDIESHVYKEGILKALTLQYEGRNRALGGFLPERRSTHVGLALPDDSAYSQPKKGSGTQEIASTMALPAAISTPISARRT